MDAQQQPHGKRFLTAYQWAPIDEQSPKPKRGKPCRKCRHPREYIVHDDHNKRWCRECGEYLDS